jgi:hypothetical protein
MMKIEKTPGHVVPGYSWVWENFLCIEQTSV